MPGWNGSGTFERYYDWTDDEAAGQNIESARFDQENDTFAAGINNCLCKDGQNSPSTDLPMGTNKHTGVGDGSARDHYLAVGQYQDGAVLYGTSAGAANVQTLTLSPAITAYAAGQRIAFKAGYTNTGATTLNVNGVGAKNIYLGGEALQGGEIVANEIYVVIYDGTQFQLLSPYVPKAHACRVYESITSLLITDGNNSDLGCDSEVFDTDTLHDTVTNNERITVPSGLYGIWSFSTEVYCNLNGQSGYVTIKIKTQGGNEICESTALISATDHNPHVVATGLWNMASGDAYAYVNAENQSNANGYFEVEHFSAHFVGKA